MFSAKSGHSLPWLCGTSTQLSELAVCINWKPAHPPRSSSVPWMGFMMVQCEVQRRRQQEEHSYNCNLIIHFSLSLLLLPTTTTNNRRIGNTEMHNLTGLYPDLEYPIWLAARSQRGEGATTPPIRVRTKPYGKLQASTVAPLLQWLCHNTTFQPFPRKISA